MSWDIIVIGAGAAGLMAAIRASRPQDGRFHVATSTRAVEAQRVIVTSGGCSYPGSGTTGDGYTMAARLGHGIVPARPALVPVRVVLPWVNDLRGITLPDTA